MKCCALTGHRELPPSFDRNALADGLRGLVSEGYDYFFCGMAQGFDLLALECLVRIKAERRVFVEACVPYRGQENGFPSAERRRYRELIGWCDRTTILYDRYTKGCLLARDRYMVDRADLLFAYCVKREGGAAYTVRYAERVGVEVRYLGGTDLGAGNF